MAAPNSYVVLDFETGGFSPTENAIVEFAYIIIRGDDFSEICQAEMLVRPYDPKLIYSPEAEKVHGLSKEQLLEEGLELKEVAERFSRDLKSAKISTSGGAKPVIVGHNVAFDIAFLQHLAFYSGKVLKLDTLLDGKADFYGNFQPNFLDTLKFSRMIWQHDEEVTKYTLDKTLERAGLEVTDAHRALNDVAGTRDFFVWVNERMRSEAEEKAALTQAKVRSHFKI